MFELHLSFSTGTQASRSIILPLRNASQKTYKYKCPGMRELVLDDLDNSHDAFADLFSSVTMIVSPYPQHYNLQQKKNKFMTEHMLLIVQGQYTVPEVCILS